MEKEMFDVIIIGAGQSGLSVSHFLKKESINHLVLERGKIGESWRSQRWDSFVLNTPNFTNSLPDDPYDGGAPDGFMHRDEFISYLENYAQKFQLPVKEHSIVMDVTRLDEVLFEVNVKNENGQKHYLCRQVVIALGAMSIPKIPDMSESFPENIHQMHAASYRHPGQLPDGATLVVGSGQSGCQITEDLLEAGKKVYLSTSKVGRIPRRHMGRDIFEWMAKMKFFDAHVDSIEDPAVLKAKQPQVSGVGRNGRTVSLQSLHRQGASIIGYLESIRGDEINLRDDAAANVRFADEFSANIKKMIDKYIIEQGIDCDAGEEDFADVPDVHGSCADTVTNISLMEENITSVIWATGFTTNLDWIRPSVTDDQGKPDHKEGVAAVKGIYFIGFPWLRTRKSGIIYGLREDASHIVNHIKRQHANLHFNE